MRVMVIDDSPTIRKIVEVALRREGYQVEAFPNALEAMRYLMSNKPPNLILLDIDLPKVNGYELARSIKQKPALASIPIVMISRFCGVMDRLKARLAGASQFIAKPFKTQEIVAAVEKLQEDGDARAS